MKCIDERLRNAITGHDCQTVRYAGFAGFKNGELLGAAEAAWFQLLVTVDRGLEYEQSLRGRKLAIVILREKSNRLKDLLPHVPALQARLPSIRPGEFVKVPEEPT
jgi:hypothetical protein